MSTRCELYKEEFNHNFCRRKRGHDYRSVCRYHIILKKAPEFRKFGEVTGNADIPFGQKGCADIALNPFGKIIRKAIEDFPTVFPFFQNYQYKVMPDHVHWFLFAKQRLPCHLGKYISLLKAGIREEILKIYPRELSSEDIFLPNYTDKIVKPGMDFNVIYNYIRENPHRLAMRIQHPDFFQRIDEIIISGNTYSSYGNQFLLKNPFKSSVIIHRKNTPQENIDLKNEWMRTARIGGVLVSPFISRSEKAIRDEAEFNGSKFILIQDEPFGEKYKPAKHNFELCSEGRLLIIAPKLPMKEESFRRKCLIMNKLAQDITTTCACTL